MEPPARQRTRLGQAHQDEARRPSSGEAIKTRHEDHVVGTETAHQARVSSLRSPRASLAFSRKILVAPAALIPGDGRPALTSNAAGCAFLQMLGVFAEFETAIRRERQMEGVARAKAEGVYKGRRPSIDAAKVRALAWEGLGGSEIARRLKIGRASVYRLLAENAREA
jgi:DNA invertase Pin-like site-specific DNA recombinase